MRQVVLYPFGNVVRRIGEHMNTLIATIGTVMLPLGIFALVQGEEWRSGSIEVVGTILASLGVLLLILAFELIRREEKEKRKTQRSLLELVLAMTKEFKEVKDEFMKVADKVGRYVDADEDRQTSGKPKGN